jgi:hypothetical protein
MPVIPATQKEERTGKIKVQSHPGQKLETPSKNKLKAKGLGMWLKWSSTGLEGQGLKKEGEKERARDST